MKLRALAGIAVVALVAVAALAFENTSWHGDLKCTVKAKVAGEKTEKETEVQDGIDLYTSDTTVSIAPLPGGSLEGIILKKNNTHYDVALPTDEMALAGFNASVKAKILAQTGLDVDLATVEMKGKCTLIQRFQKVKVNITVKWSGTVASGEHMGKDVSGSITFKGTLPRD